MDLGLAGKTALVTGATKGIGRATATLLAEEGANLEIAARTAEDVETTAKALSDAHGVTVNGHVADLSQSDDQARLAADCAHVDIVINCAGAIPGGEITDVDEATWRQSWDLKVFGYINLCRAFYETMAARGDGVIVNVIGQAGERNNAKYIAGSAANAGLMALTRALGSRSPDAGVRVVGINPGMTKTERGEWLLSTWAKDKYGDESRGADVERDMNLPFGRMGLPEELANVIVFAASPRASYVSGTIISVDGGGAHRNF